VNYKGYDIETIYKKACVEVYITKDGQKFPTFRLPDPLPGTEQADIIQYYLEALEGGREAGRA